MTKVIAPGEDLPDLASVPGSMSVIIMMTTVMIVVMTNVIRMPMENMKKRQMVLKRFSSSRKSVFNVLISTSRLIIELLIN